MEISTITSFRTVQNKNNQPQQISVKNYQFNNIRQNRNTSPNFGKYVLDDLFFWGKKKLNNAREAQRNYHVKNLHKKALDDIKILSKRLGISEFQAEKKYQADLDLGGIKPKLDGHEVGLNKVIGYSLEKLELIKQAVVPIIKTQEAKQAGKEIPFEYSVPSGIILHGEPGTGKSHMAESLLEHIGIKARDKNLKINTIIIDKPWDKGDTDENIFAIWKTFEKAQEAGKKGEHSVIMINNFDKLMSAKDAEILQNEVSYQTQHPAKDGITWIATINDKNKLTEEYYDKNRTSLMMPIGRMKSEAEVSAVFSHFIAQVNRKDKLNHDEILDYAEQNNLPFVPGKIKKVIDNVDDFLMKNKDKSEYEEHFGQTFNTGGYKEPVRDEYVKKVIKAMYGDSAKS